MAATDAYKEMGLSTDLYALVKEFETSPGVTDTPNVPNSTNTYFDAFMEDNAVGSSKISSLTADKIITGTIQAGRTVFVGTNALKFDGTQRQIIVSDGTYDIILIGEKDGFF